GNLTQLQNHSGLLPNDRPHQAKVYGSYEWSFGLTTGVFGQFYSGTPITKRGAYPVFHGTGKRFIAPRGSSGRTPDIYTLDLRLGYSIPVGKLLSVDLFGDVFNLTNAQRALTVDENWTFAAAATTADPAECGGPGTGPGTSSRR